MGDMADFALDHAWDEIEHYDRYHDSDPQTRYEEGLIDEQGYTIGNPNSLPTATRVRSKSRIDWGFVPDPLHYHHVIEFTKIKQETTKSYLLNVVHGDYTIDLWIPKKIIKGMGEVACHVYTPIFYDILQKAVRKLVAEQ